MTQRKAIEQDRKERVSWARANIPQARRFTIEGPEQDNQVEPLNVYFFCSINDGFTQADMAELAALKVGEHIQYYPTDSIVRRIA